MKKIIYLALALTFSLGAVSCGGGSSEGNNSESKEKKTYEPVSVEVKDPYFEGGDMSLYVRLVPGTYTLTAEGDRAEAKINVRAAMQTDNQLSGSSSFGVYDEEGNQITTMTLRGGWTDLNKALKEGDTTQEFTLTLSHYEDDMDNLMSKAKEIRGLEAKEDTRSSDSSESSSSDDSSSISSSEDSSSSSSSGSSMINQSELKTFISDGKSGDIDKMIAAYEWLNKQESALKPKVRNLNEDAVKAAIELDKANEEVGSKYGTLTIRGALFDMVKNMTPAQESRFNKADSNAVLYFTSQDDTSGYDNLYRKLRYGF